MNVSTHHFRRHLGLPADAAITGRVLELMEWAREWYAAHGSPWSRTCRRRIERLEPGSVHLEAGAVLRPGPAACRLRAAGAEALFIVAASAGEAIDDEARRLWSEGRPDESFFLGALGITVAEDLREAAERALRHEIGACGATLLPRAGPGYEDWDLHDMAAVLAALGDCGPLRATPAGGLVPEKSTVVVIASARPDGAARTLDMGSPAAGAAHAAANGTGDVPEKTLARWSRERLRVEARGAGRLVATFRFDGKTCSSLSRPLAYEYRLDLACTGAGYRIEAGACAPAGGDRGHRFQCEYLSDPEGFSALAAAPPEMVGQELGSACANAGDVSPSACLCTAANRRHKWRLVAKTVQYALAADGRGEAT